MNIIQIGHPSGGNMIEWIPREDGFPEGEASFHICSIIPYKPQNAKISMNCKVFADHIKPLPVADAGKDHLLVLRVNLS